MAFSKQRPRKWSGRKTETRSHAAKTFARKRRDWIVPFATSCNLYCINPADICPNGGKIPLINNSQLRAGLHDSVRVVRILGDLWFLPQEPLQTGPCNPGVTMTQPTQMMVGLLKQQALAVLAGVTPAVNPLAYDPVNDYASDFSEVKWMHQWAHRFERHGELGFRFNASTCCSVSASYVVPPIVEGEQEGYTVPAIVCNPCPLEDPDTPCQIGFAIESHRAWKIHLDWKRPIVLNGDDDLGLYVGWEKLGICGGPRLPQEVMTVSGMVRMIVEM